MFFHKELPLSEVDGSWRDVLPAAQPHRSLPQVNSPRFSLVLHSHHVEHLDGKRSTLNSDVLKKEGVLDRVGSMVVLTPPTTWTAEVGACKAQSMTFFFPDAYTLDSWDLGNSFLYPRVQAPPETPRITCLVAAGLSLICWESPFVALIKCEGCRLTGRDWLLRIHMVISHRLSQQSRGHLKICIVISSFPSAEKFLVVWRLPGIPRCVHSSGPFLAADGWRGNQWEKSILLWIFHKAYDSLGNPSFMKAVNSMQCGCWGVRIQIGFH